MSTNAELQKSTIYAPIGYRMNIKRAMVNSLKVTFNNNYPDTTMRNMFISMDWPDKPQQYPAMLVDYVEGKLRNAGIGHFGFFDENKLFKRWMYDGTIRVVIIAETNLQREFVCDHFVNMFAFGTLSTYTNTFLEYFLKNEGLEVQVLRDTLTPTSPTVEKGTSWGLEDATLYVSGYSFGIVGSFTSSANSYGFVRGVNESFTISN
jgi:hypothetical protein